jgi:hypothetical protein
MKLLQIAYHYPPMGGAGVQRSVKLSKYLVEFGIEPVVLAGLDPHYAADASLLADVPAGADVRRIEHRPLVQRLIAWRGQRQAARPSAPGPAFATSGARQRDRLLAAYASVLFPDDKAGWARSAFGPGRELLREHGVELILSSAPPMSSHALAARLSRAAGVPWVADYRDLWTDNPAYAAPAWRRALDRRAEARWLASAAGVVTVTPTLARALAARLPADKPLAMIPNGYDEADFTAVDPAPREAGCCRVVHAGTLYGHQSPQPLLEAAAALFEREPALASTLRLRLVGQVGARFEPALAAFAGRFPGVLQRTGFVDHRRAVSEMLAADLLVLIIGGGPAARGVLSGKVFEYLRAGRPILLIGPADGDAAQLLRSHADGVVTEPPDIAGIAAALRGVCLAEAPPPPGDAAAARYERRALAQQMAVFLRRCRGQRGD